MSVVRNGTLAFFALLLAVSTLSAQSADQNFPTPITSSELNGVIKPRDLGDPRLTTYYYAFDGAQGDIFINVVAKNFAGDIDVFRIDGLLPLAKMVFYPDLESTETGRLIYLRKPERLLLRIQGRPPADEPASFKVKFGGAFIAPAPLKKGEEAPKLPDISAENTTTKVNSVGTIVEVAPKPVPPARTEANEPVKESAKPETSGKAAIGKPSDLPVWDTRAEDRSKPKVVITDAPDVPTIFDRKKNDTAPATKTTAQRPGNPPAKSATAAPAKETAKPPVAEKSVDPMASIRLVVQMKNGDVIDRPMSEVLTFNVNRGMLTVITKDGKVTRTSMLEVSKVTIEQP